MERKKDRGRLKTLDPEMHTIQLEKASAIELANGGPRCHGFEEAASRQGEGRKGGREEGRKKVRQE